VVNITPCALHPGLGAPVPLHRAAGWAQEPVWLFFERRKLLLLMEFEPLTAWVVA